MGSRKKLRRSEAASNKANSSPPRDTLPQEWYDDAMSLFDGEMSVLAACPLTHCACGCGSHGVCFNYGGED